MNETIIVTQEERARHYSAALDSVAIINSDQPDAFSEEEWKECIKRNVEHLEIMVVKDFWVGEDMKPFTDAIAAGKTATS
jgi:hypothetical protein